MFLIYIHILYYDSHHYKIMYFWHEYFWFILSTFKNIKFNKGEFSIVLYFFEKGLGIVMG